MKKRNQQILWSIGIFASVVLMLAASSVEAPAQAFGYACEICPANWADLSPDFSLCGSGLAQSPIAVSTKNAGRKRLPRLRVMFKRSDFTVVRPNPTNFEAEPEAQLGIRIGRTTYTLLQFHFHSLSEHFVNGEQLPLEVHFVHQTEDGDLAVLAVFIEEGRANAEIDKLIAILDEVKTLEVKMGAAVLLEDFDPRELLADKRGTCRYIGSTTTPPCTEDVLWLLLPQPITFSAEQIESIQEVIRDFNAGFDNNRPIQPLNGRKVFCERKGRDDDDDDNDDDDD